MRARRWPAVLGCRSEDHDHGKPEPQRPVLREAADRVLEVVDQRDHPERHPSTGKQPGSARDPQHAVGGGEEEPEEGAVEESEGAVPDRRELEPAREEVQGPDSVLGSGVHQHRPPMEHLVDGPQEEVVVKLDHLVGGESAEGRAGLEDDQVRYGQQAEDDDHASIATPHATRHGRQAGATAGVARAERPGRQWRPARAEAG